MNKRIFKVVLLAVVMAMFFASGCASPRKRALKSTIAFYDKSYDEIWNVLNDFLSNDLSCYIDSEDKASGRIETGWVHTMDMDGYNRWKLNVKVKKKKNVTRCAPVLRHRPSRERPIRSRCGAPGGDAFRSIRQARWSHDGPMKARRFCGCVAGELRPACGGLRKAQSDFEMARPAGRCWGPRGRSPTGNDAKT